jgi:23S rRNA pseudouridine2605 synthase
MPGKTRLDRALSKLGVASRSEARALIEAGRVTVAGRTVTDPSHLVTPERSAIAVGGARVARTSWRTIALHKTRGTITARRDPEGRPTVFDALGPIATGMIAVGRLDMASTGLLLLTTDTQLAARLTDPAAGIVRRYIVTARGNVTDEEASAIVAGIGGLAAHSVDVLKRSNRETHLAIELTEGRNREIRRLLASTGHEVTRLLRVAYGGIELGNLKPGGWRDVSREEIARGFLMRSRPISGSTRSTPSQA